MESVSRWTTNEKQNGVIENGQNVCRWIVCWVTNCSIEFPEYMYLFSYKHNQHICGFPSCGEQQICRQLSHLKTLLLYHSSKHIKISSSQIWGIVKKSWMTVNLFFHNMEPAHFTGGDWDVDGLTSDKVYFLFLI